MKKEIKIIIGILAIGVLVFFGVYTVSSSQLELKQRESYERGYYKGWGDNTDAQLCLIGGKAALSGSEIPFFRGCVTEEEAEEMGVSYTFRFKDWCEIYGNCEEVGYGYYDD